MSGNTRLAYIDTCKGILIIMLICCHINSMAKGLLPEISMMELEKIDITKYLYVPYFMQTFFFITGYCSNFNKYNGKIKSFLFTNFNTLIIPLICFASIDQLFNSIVFHTNFFFVEVLGKEFFYLFELFWFLPALFMAKFIMLIINNVSTKLIIQISIVCILFLFATFFIQFKYHSFNYMHWHNSLSMLPFLYLGYVFKRYGLFNRSSRVWFIISISYFLIIAFLYYSGRLIPYYTHFSHYTYKYVPLYLWLAFSGSIMIITISKALPTIKWLSYIGKNSIVVYGMHFTILSIVIIFLKYIFIPKTLSSAISFYIITGGVSLVLAYCLCHLFQKKPLSYLIGRF